MREILPELEQRRESLHRKARNWERVTGKREVILKGRVADNTPRASYFARLIVHRDARFLLTLYMWIAIIPIEGR
jgi:hypothetical protein